MFIQGSRFDRLFTAFASGVRERGSTFTKWSVFIVVVVPVIALLGVPAFSEPPQGSATDPTGKSLETMKSLLADYERVRKEFESDGELELAKAVSVKIKELREQIEAEQNRLGGPTRGNEPESMGISPVKADRSSFVTRSCSELRSMLIRLIRESNALKRRSGGVLSGPTEQDRWELRRVQDRITSVKESLRARCGVRASPR